METNLARQLKRFTTMMILIQVASIAAILMIFVIFNYFVKVRIATLVQEEARHALLAGDLRQAVITFESVRADEFSAVRYVDRQGHLVFSIPSEIETTVAPSSSLFYVTKTLPLTASDGSDASLGRIEFSFSLVGGMEYALLLASMLMAGSVPLASRFRRRLEQRYQLELGARYDSAVARTTQMLAHDVRKPFSTLRMGLTLLNNAESSEQTTAILQRLIPEIDQAVTSVNGLIQDVMESGATSASLRCEDVGPEALIERALADCFRSPVAPGVDIAYEFTHKHHVCVDVTKVGRVLSNIIGNALQATQSRGDIWIKTRETKGFVEFCIGNSGSFIAPEDRAKVFDPFYTKGKKGGTGLGLAIAQKIVVLHGGRIWCTSSQDTHSMASRVEFRFTLPATGSPKKTEPTNPPAHSSVYRTSLFAADLSQQSIADERGMEMAVIKATVTLGRPLQILLVDDEQVARGAVATALQSSLDLRSVLSFSEADGSIQAIEQLEAEPFDLVITDIDMGQESLDGFDLTRQLIVFGTCKPFICIHSNRVLAVDQESAFASGAQAFLAKPATRHDLLHTVLRAAQLALANRPPLDALVAKPEVAVVEDNPFAREAWVAMLSADAVVYPFVSPEDFEAKVMSDAGFLDRLACVITDYRFKNSTRNGTAVGRLVKQSRPALPVLLSSDRDVDAAELAGAIDQAIAKDPVAFATLQGEILLALPRNAAAT